MRGFSVQPTIVNGIAGITNGGIDPANIERIEAIKGPSGTLYGSSLISFGGLINIVTKKPYDTFGGSVDYTIGGFGLSRIAADINTPLGKDTTVLFRLNTALHHEGSFQDAGFKKAIFIAPSLKYSPNERLTFIFNAEYLEPESTNPTMIFLNRSRQLIARTPSELKMDFDRSYTSNDISIKTPTFNISGQASYKLSDSWTSQTNISRGIRKSDGYYSYIMFLDASPSGPIAANDTLISRYLTYQNAIQTTTNIQQNFIGDFNIGKFRNRIVAGLDFIQSQSTNNSAPYIVFDYLNVTNPADPRYGNLSRSALDLRLAEAGGTTRSSTNNYVYGIYASDVFNITDRLLAMASLRYDYFDNKPSVNHKTGIESGKYAQGALSPKFGVVYELMKDQISVFANYMNGFRNVSPIANNELAGYPVNMKPQQANQKEVGVKIELPKQHLAVTASYYDISVDNQSRSITVDNPDPSGDPLNVTIQDGTQLSKGLEVDIIASPVNGLRIIGGFGYNDSKISKAAPATEGRRPTSAGPAYLANFWLSYTAPSGVLKGIGIGLGGNYASENLITSSLATGDFYLPEYTVLNSSLYYDAKQYRVGIKVDNLTDKEYFGGWSTIEKQLPRRVSANISFKF
jgi:iron complex outermembrane receptor protein